MKLNRKQTGHEGRKFCVFLNRSNILFRNLSLNPIRDKISLDTITGNNKRPKDIITLNFPSQCKPGTRVAFVFCFLCDMPVAKYNIELISKFFTTLIQCKKRRCEKQKRNKKIKNL